MSAKKYPEEKRDAGRSGSRERGRVVVAPSTLIMHTTQSMESGEEFCQLRLPLYREVGRNGLFLQNTAFADGMRRSVTKRLPQGAPVMG